MTQQIVSSTRDSSVLFCLGTKLKCPGRPVTGGWRNRNGNGKRRTRFRFRRKEVVVRAASGIRLSTRYILLGSHCIRFHYDSLDFTPSSLPY